MSTFRDRIAGLPPKRLALLALELHAKIEQLEQQRPEAIAIIGMGCRFPGGADSPEAFWRLLRDGVDAIGEVPHQRWVDDLAETNAGEPAGRGFGGFLSGIDLFDPQFFGITPREAASMDPQQRLLLEVCWEALEHAGQAPTSLEGSRTGVFVGIAGFDFAQILLSADRRERDVYTASGASHAIAAGRLSYVLGLQGPCLSIDTACSSSLVAIHQACQSLLTSECRMAIAGGVNAILTPDTSISLSRSGMLAPDGRCKTFDARADGFVRSEGCGIVVLKRLADARHDGDRIHAIIRGSAINQDGRSSGITAPNGPAQEAVVSETLRRAGVAPHEVQYVETHGTGTVLGDPIEARALGAVLGRDRAAADPLLLGSVKTNIGHLEAAAGVAGLIKVVLSLAHGEIPKSLHFEQRNPHIEWERLNLEVVSRRRPWPAPGSVRRAAVSSLGFSGTNAHVLLEEAPPPPERSAEGDQAPAHVLTLSARSETALATLVERYRADLAGDDERQLADICFTANTGRALFDYRLAVVAGSRRELVEALSTPALAAVIRGRRIAADPPPIAFLFTGQGAQYVGMGRELYATQPVFRNALDRCDRIAREPLGLSLASLLYPASGVDGGSPIDQTQFAQPALFAFEYALFELWQSWGIMPAAVMGHSLGEYVAACAAGALDLENALRFVVERGRLMQALPAGGAMAAVMCDEALVRRTIAGSPLLSIAAINGPSHLVIAGPAEELGRAAERFAADGVEVRRLRGSHAFHSPLLDPILDALQDAAATLQVREPAFEIVSNVTGRVVDPRELAAADYWRRQARQPVRFADGIQALYATGCRTFLEIGPKPVLSGMAPGCLDHGDVTWLASLRRGASETRQMLASLGALYVGGATVRFAGPDRDRGRVKVPLPTSPFERVRHWPSPPAAPRSAPPPASWKKWLFAQTWTDVPAAADLRGWMQPAREVAARLDTWTEAAAAPQSAAYAALLPHLDALCSAFIIRAWRRLGWRPERGEQFDTKSLRRRLRVSDRHMRLFDRLLQILAEDGLLEPAADGWTVSDVASVPEPDAMCQRLLTEFPECAIELRMLAACGARLDAVLTGAVDATSVLFPDGSLDQADQLYGESPVSRMFTELVGRAVADATSHQPADRTLRVLEVGAGTGGTTAAVLRALSGHPVDYAFTDVSSFFFGKAREKFGSYPFMRYRRLDIESEPVTQGFEAGSFDLVIAANVFHATAEIRTTLRHVRTLLADSGMLVLLEGNQTTRFGDLTVGLSDGWWRFSDRDYALMPPSRWINALQESGFTDAVACPSADPATDRTAWQQSILLAQAARGAGGQTPAVVPIWLVLADRGGVATQVVTRLSEGGSRVVVVEPGNGYDVSANRVRLDPARLDDFERLIRDFVPAGSALGVVSLWSLDQPSSEDDSVEAVEASVRRNYESALHLAKALVVSKTGPSRLIFVTRGAQAVHVDDQVAPGQATVAGLARVIGLEHPDRRCTSVDLEPGGNDADAAGHLTDILRAGDEGGELAIRAGRLVRAGVGVWQPASTPAAPLPISANATYLVTGGLAGLGLLTAEWLVSRGARHLVLLGRSAPQPEAVALIARLQESGVSVAVVRGDVSCAADLRRALTAAPESAPLRGVIHSAGTTDDAILLHQDWRRFESVMAAKVTGAWLLHTLTRDRPLDFFVLYSSGASMLGSRGQANHAAANAFLDALAHRRRALGQPALAINWGPWSGTGAATRVRSAAAVTGHGSIDPASGFDVLEYLMRHGPTRVGVLPLDDAESARRQVMIGGQRPASEWLSSSQAVAKSSVAEEMRETSPGRMKILLAEHIQRAAATVIGLGPTDTIDPEQPLMALGLDSLMALELKNALAGVVGQSLPATLLFNYPTVTDLVGYLSGVLVAPYASLATAPIDSPILPVESAADLDALSENELEALLAEKVRQGETGQVRQ